MCAGVVLKAVSKSFLDIGSEVGATLLWTDPVAIEVSGKDAGCP
jgi:hypothetical protein